MATDYGARFSKAVGCTRHAMGGAAEGLGIEALAGDTEMVTVFDDFDGVVTTETFGGTAYWEQVGWVLSDANDPTGDEVGMNDPANTDTYYGSNILLFGGTDDDDGGSMQLDLINGSVGGGGAVTAPRWFNHMWIAETDAGAAINDNTTWVFAARVGLQSGDTTAIGTTSGDWESKFFVGYSAAGDTGILVRTTGLPDVATQGGPIVGIAGDESGRLVGHAQRTANTALAEGTNFTYLTAAGGVDGNTGNGATAANQKMWFDIAFRMDIVDQSEAADNGYVRFYWRRVLPGQPLGDWLTHPTVLTNQCPNHTVALVPIIEFINGPTADQDGVMAVDWWCMGRNRINR